MQLKRKNLLRLFLFCPVILFSQELFTFPDESQYFMHTYLQSIKNTEKQVYILSSGISNYYLINTIKALSKKKIKVFIISTKETTKKDKTSYLSLLNNVYLYSLASHQDRVLKGSLTCIDNTIVYLSSENMNAHTLNKNYAYAMRSFNPCEKYFKSLLIKAKNIR